MKNFEVDYSLLDTDKKFYRLADVKDRLIKIGFDIVKFKNGDPDELWQIQSADDGEFIVAKYEMDTPKVEKTASVSHWDIHLNQKSGDINLFYKGFAVVKASMSDVGLKTEDFDLVKKYLPNKLAADKTLVNSLLKNLSASEKYELLRLYPELQ